MTATRKLIFALVFAVSVGLLIIGLGTGYGNKPTQNVGDEVPPEQFTQSQNSQSGKDTTPAAPTQTPKVPSKEVPIKSGPKVLTMAEAVVIAERIGKGYTMKAERKDRPDISFKFEIMSIDGTKKRIELTADGQLKPESKTTETKAGKKRPN